MDPAEGRRVGVVGCGRADTCMGHRQASRHLFRTCRSKCSRRNNSSCHTATATRVRATATLRSRSPRLPHTSSHSHTPSHHKRHLTRRVYLYVSCKRMCMCLVNVSVCVL